MCFAWKAPPEWRAFYSGKNFFQRDPAVRQCRRSVMPFDWTSSPYNPETGFRWGEVLARGRDFNIHKGIVVPIPSPTGMIGLVWGAGPHFDERKTYMVACQREGTRVSAGCVRQKIPYTLNRLAASSPVFLRMPR